MKYLLLLAFIALVTGGCQVIKQAGCKQKFVTVTVVSQYGNYQMQVPYCDTLYVGSKRPDSIRVEFRKE